MIELKQFSGKLQTLNKTLSLLLNESIFPLIAFLKAFFLSFIFNSKKPLELPK